MTNYLYQRLLDSSSTECATKYNSNTVHEVMGLSPGSITSLSLVKCCEAPLTGFQWLIW
jgi:hypothetical protein